MKHSTSQLCTAFCLLLASPTLTFAYLSNGRSKFHSRTTTQPISQQRSTTASSSSHFTSLSSNSPSLITNQYSHPSKTSQRTTTTHLYSTTSDNNNDEENPSNKLGINERALGILVLMTVPLSWGTYAPVVRYVYEINPPVPGFVFSAGYYLVASLSLLSLANLTDKGPQQQQQQQQQQQLKENEAAENTPNGDSTKKTTSLPIQGGLELGLYLFLGNALQVIGLKTVPADRAAFLVQLTTIMVPLVQAFTTKGGLLTISIRTWMACVLAFSGVVVMGFDGKETAAGGLLLSGGGDGSIMTSFASILNTFTGGDLLIVAAAFVYTLHVVRLGRYAPYTTPISLAASKATTEAILSVGLVLALLSCATTTTVGDVQSFPSFVVETGNEINTFFTSIQNAFATNSIPMSTLLPAAGAILWTGWVTCAYTIYAQSFGQRRVSPTDANLIYTTQPLFSALFAWVILGETLGEAGYVGAGLIGVALWLVTDNGGNDASDNGGNDKLEDDADIGRANLPLSLGKKMNGSVSGKEREALQTRR